MNINTSTNLFARNPILTLQSLIHNQFSHARFKPFIRMSWVSAGLIDGKTDYENPIHVCFNQLAKCTEHKEVDSVIKCAYCEKELCFHDFFTQYHIH